MSKIDNIKGLVKQMEDKNSFVTEVAKDIKRSRIYILQRWFQDQWVIPEEYQDRIIKLAQNYIKQELQRKQEKLKELGVNFKIKHYENSRINKSNLQRV